MAHILLLYNKPILPPGHPESHSEVDILENVDAVEHILHEGGHEVTRLAVGADLRVLFDALSGSRPDIVFNLFEGLADRPFTEDVVTGMLEWFDLSFTGSPATTLALARNKMWAKHVLRGAGLPTPEFFIVDQLPAPANTLCWPVIVKPLKQDASLGIEQASVVSNQADMEQRLAFVLERYGPAIVESYIGGREFLIHVVEGAPDERGRCVPLVLPPAEIAFRDPARWPIYTYQAKWLIGTEEFEAAPVVAPSIVPPEVHERVVHVARRAFEVVGCRDYARIDMRITEKGEVYILEVNPNPFITSEALYEGLDAVGRNHDQFILELAEAALARRAKCVETA